jgi:hypothetical protein
VIEREEYRINKVDISPMVDEVLNTFRMTFLGSTVKGSEAML